MYYRELRNRLEKSLKRGKSILLLGPRQTGKTTLSLRIQTDWTLSFISYETRQRYEKNPGLLIAEIKSLAKKLKRVPIVLVDEIQKVPDIMDSVQLLIDEKVAQFILTGSSARKLNNLLPGRVLKYHLSPLILSEYKKENLSLEKLLLYGTLPGILSINDDRDKEEELQSYVGIYLEEEIRKEAVTRNIKAFQHFLTLACSESGKLVSFRSMSREIGISHTTITDYYQILSDCMTVETVFPYTKNGFRKKLSKSLKYLMFDLGIRRAGAREGQRLTRETMGHLFEQWVGLEFIRYARYAQSPIKIYYWRDANGPEVDWVIETEDEIIPVEVKYSDSPSLKDAKHVSLFINEYTNAKKGYIISQTSVPYQLSEEVTVLPWQDILSVF